MPHTKGKYVSEQGFAVRDENGNESSLISSSGIFGISPKATVATNATTGAVATADFPKNNTNTGSSATMVLTLPAASAVKGKFMRFQLTVAQIVQLTPASGEKIYLGGSGVADKYLNIAGVIGNYAVLYSDGTDYLVTDYSGVLTKES